MNNIIYYLLGFFALIYIARMMGEKAVKMLNAEQKAGLIDLFAKQRKFGTLIVFVLVAAFLVVLQFKLIEPMIAFSAYFGIMLLYMVFRNYQTYSKLKANDYPQEYINKFMSASILATLGIATFFGLVFYQSFVQ